MVDFSSQSSDSRRPEFALDANPNTFWVTANGQSTDQYLTVQLTGDTDQVIDSIVLRGTTQDYSLRDFELRISDNGSDFTTVLANTVPQNGLYHTSQFAPVEAH